MGERFFHRTGLKIGFSSMQICALGPFGIDDRALVSHVAQLKSSMGSSQVVRLHLHVRDQASGNTPSHPSTRCLSFAG